MDYYKAYKKYKKKYKELLGSADTGNNGNDPPQYQLPVTGEGQFIHIESTPGHQDPYQEVHPTYPDVFRVTPTTIIGTLRPDLIDSWAINAIVESRFGSGCIGYLVGDIDEPPESYQHLVIDTRSTQILGRGPYAWVDLNWQYRIDSRITLRSSEIPRVSRQLQQALDTLTRAVPTGEHVMGDDSSRSDVTGPIHQQSVSNMDRNDSSSSSSSSSSEEEEEEEN